MSRKVKIGWLRVAYSEVWVVFTAHAQDCTVLYPLGICSVFERHQGHVRHRRYAVGRLEVQRPRTDLQVAGDPSAIGLSATTRVFSL